MIRADTHKFSARKWSAKKLAQPIINQSPSAHPPPLPPVSRNVPTAARQAEKTVMGRGRARRRRHSKSGVRGTHSAVRKAVRDGVVRSSAALWKQ